MKKLLMVISASFCVLHAMELDDESKSIECLLNQPECSNYFTSAGVSISKGNGIAVAHKGTNIFAAFKEGEQWKIKAKRKVIPSLYCCDYEQAIHLFKEEDKEQPPCAVYMAWKNGKRETFTYNIINSNFVFKKKYFKELLGCDKEAICEDGEYQESTKKSSDFMGH